MAANLPVHLTYAESTDLRKRIERAIVDARDGFINTHLVRDAKGTPTNGPDPRTVDAEVALILARILGRLDLDVTGVAAWEAKLARLEAEVDRCCGVTKVTLGLGSVDGEAIRL
jgi:hypothetical protein